MKFLAPINISDALSNTCTVVFKIIPHFLVYIIYNLIKFNRIKLHKSYTISSYTYISTFNII